MQTRHFIAIATLTVALTSTTFGQWHPDLDKIPTRKAKTQTIKSPRDAASGQATGRRKALGANGALLEFQIPEKVTHRNPAAGHGAKQLQPGNSGGTITNQRRPNRRK